VTISVLIPALNEGPSVRQTIERVRAVMEGAGLEHEIIVIDDGSTDDTEAQARVPGVKVLQHPASSGYGRALKTGLRVAEGEWIAITDADGSYPIEVLPDLLAFTPRFDMVVGARTGPHYRGSATKWLGRKVLESMVHFVAGVWIPDVNSGLRVFRKTIALDNIKRIGDGFSFTTTLTLTTLLEGHYVRYVPIAYHARIGHTKVKMRRDMLRTIQILVMTVVAYNPIKMFLFLAYFALLALVPCIGVDLLVTGGTNSGIILAMLVGTALVLFGFGLVTDVLRRLR
jgi:glycosyltransferase involved in cell wall biosynthesis